MRALLALGLLALSLAAPSAVADQAIVQGPASVTTTNTATGDCDDNGYVARTAAAEVAVDEHNRFGAWLANGCTAFSRDGWSEQHGWLNVGAGRCGDWGCGPYSAVWWNGDHWSFESYSWGSCSSGFYASGPVLFLGCPSLDGSGPPMLPELP
ncbi:MAG TPA: hypothetical protein VGR28_13150 [Candidatus Thermoplasmatota archaeon]|jgi:hypothetical protein|nr:hypothetical protein [Candidatus Thermoplasmatota archaeon]